MSRVNIGDLPKDSSFVLLDDSKLSKVPGQQKRDIVDESTSAFIKTIVSSDLEYSLFLNFFSIMELYLNYYINMRNSMRVGEYCKVYFKGGNVMNYHFNKAYPPGTPINNLYGKYFSKSDFDFGVSLKTKNSNRFSNLKPVMTDAVYNFLSKTSQLFNNYYEEIDRSTITRYDNYVDNFYDPSIKLDLTKYQAFNDNIAISMINRGVTEDMLDKPFNYSKNYDDYILNIGGIIYTGPSIDNKVLLNLRQNIRDGLILKQNGINDFMDLTKRSKYHAILLAPWLQRLGFNIDFGSLFETVMQNNLYELVKINFYSKEKFKTMIDTIVASQNQLLDKVFYEEGKNIQYNQYRILPIEEKDIMIIGRSNFTVYNDYEKEETVTQIDDANLNNIHYISRNYSIKVQSINRNNIDFDLHRIKFNMVIHNKVLKNGDVQTYFNIPSEFVDIGITNFNDTNYNESKMDYFIENDYGYHVPIRTHDYPYFISDLVRVMFIDGGSFPWLKSKYQKRAYRWLVLLNMLNRENTASLNKLSNDILENKFNEKDWILAPIENQYYKNYNYMQDMVTIKNEYCDFSLPASIIIVTEKMIQTDSNTSLNMVNYFRMTSGLTPLDNLNSVIGNYHEFLVLIKETTDQLLLLD